MSASPKIPDDGLILAAIDRAYRHLPRLSSGVSRWEVLEHLDVAKRTNAARAVKERLDALTEDGVLVRTKEHSNLLWRLTSRGRRQRQKADALGELPESPQHRRWRQAREVASVHFGRGLDALGEAIIEASELRMAEPPASSDAWLLAGLRLRSACRLLAKATYCRCEWPEPDDARADIDRDAEPALPLASEDELRSIRTERIGRRSPHWHE